MSASLFERKKQLKKPLLRAGREEASSSPEAELKEVSHNSSSASLNSSPRTLNHNPEPRGSRTLDFERDVELSSTGATGAMSVNRAGEVPYLAYEEEEEEEEGEEGNDQQASDENGSDDDDELLQAGDNFSINRYSEESKTLPRPYNPEMDSIVCRADPDRSKYEEAALYIREGEDDAKFYHHPDSKWSKYAYDVLHHFLYHILHLVISLLLLLLAFAESPSIGQEDLTEKEQKALVSVHGVLEVFFLSLLGIDILLKWVWLGNRHIIKSRSTIIAVILVVMYIEALVVLGRQQSHIRITRALRPIFIIDTYYMVGVRRVLRQLFKSTKPIVHVLFLLIFFIVLFSIIGYLLFAISDPDYFSSYSLSFVSLFITQTTANNPDVMMESYAEYAATPLFFVIYIIFALYFASNILLAVVYGSFSEAEKKKFRKLLCHKLDALSRAFQILADTNAEELQIQFHDFLRFMANYKPRMPEWQVMCIFKALHKDPQNQYHGINLEEFQRFYEVLDFKWEQVDAYGEKIQWFSKFSSRIKKPIKRLHTIVIHRAYKFVVGIVVLINLIFLVIFISKIKNKEDRFSELHKVLPVSFAFLAIYVLDIILNIIGSGPSFFKKFWNLADVAMILFSFVCLCLEINPAYSYLAIVRPLKLLRLIRLKRHYRDIMNTMVALAPRLLSIFFLILIIYYSFAIIGLEFFSFKVSRGCCNKSTYGVSLYYSGIVEPPNSPNDTNSPFVYYLNNFNNILRSYVTLFILMVVNNWYIIMEGFASAVEKRHQWLARLYFMIFYIIQLVVLQVIISFIVEAFVLKIQAAQRRRVCSTHPNTFDCGCRRDKKTESIKLVEEDIAKLRYEVVYLDELSSKQKLTLNRVVKRCWRKDFSKMQTPVRLLGRRDHTKEDVNMLIYKDEIKSWVKMYRRISRLEHSRIQPRKKPTFREAAKEAATKVGMSTLNMLLD